MKKLNFWVDRPAYGRHFELHVAFDCGHHTQSLSKPIEFEQFDREFAVGHRPPALELSSTDAQALMDELYRVGIRPTKMEASDGALAATQKHLKDLQTIAFGVLATEVKLADEFRKRGLSSSSDTAGLS